jgi:hypothetical protein
VAARVVLLKGDLPGVILAATPDQETAPSVPTTEEVASLSEPWSLANVEEARAYWIDGYLLLWITGKAPNPGYKVDLDQSLLDVEPPSFVARWRQLPGVWPRVITPYSYRETFEIGDRRDQVVLHHADGSLTVDVSEYAPDQAPQLGDESAPSDVSSSISNAMDPLSGGVLPVGEAVGYSNAWDLGEALREAVRGLPPRRRIPDYLMRCEVISIGAEVGGIAGWRRVFVRVRGG